MSGRGTATATDDRLEIVQVVRRMHPYGGVGGVAYALDAAFRAQGVVASTISLRGRVARGRWGRALEVLAFTLLSGHALRRAQRRGAVVLVHGDALGGDIYVDHGLHRAVLARRPWLLAHPLHGFIWAREALRHACRSYRQLVCLSAAGEAALRRAYPASRRAPAARLPNGVDLTRFRPDFSRLARPLDPSAAKLVFVGHEFERKGLRHVLDALPHLPAGVRLQVVGGGDTAWARRYAEALDVAGRVDVLGARRDVAERLRDCDLLVLPSDYEAWPLVALEAMASGVPVLLGDIPAAREILGDDGSGGRMVGRSGAAIAEAVRTLMDDPTGFVRLRRSCVDRAQGFAWPRIARGYIELAEEVRRTRSTGRRP